ncbi:hypothetical protein A3F66_04205 [candidate division TM6 bacterium RIFCSPHIGHO2_12_FULL_32_22]|nr:MAG: hypothetical protein A3F66_04205 [candidate division TM6 bacterium RIFCSPHIGHO2_12_FULL_32_22]
MKKIIFVFLLSIFVSNRPGISESISAGIGALLGQALFVWHAETYYGNSKMGLYSLFFAPSLGAILALYINDNLK